MPILVGGGGERTTLRLVARYADACNVFGGPDMLRHKFDVLREHCEAVGRDYDDDREDQPVVGLRSRRTAGRAR